MRLLRHNIYETKAQSKQIKNIQPHHKKVIAKFKFLVQEKNR